MRSTLASLAIVLITALSSFADEGMWLFTDPPTKLLKERYGFEPTEKWLTHVQRSAVRFNSGGSGSFVSADGLVFTNHHVGADTLAKISTAEAPIGATISGRSAAVSSSWAQTNIVSARQMVAPTQATRRSSGRAPARIGRKMRKGMAVPLAARCGGRGSGFFGRREAG